MLYRLSYVGFLLNAQAGLGLVQNGAGNEIRTRNPQLGRLML
ncbi:protein of unknown function [Maridesulfovibrio hydrothermalis AM13 = DSM 14728]|uniref:Uncharacterized protein n=1 Tax=Maridesulfovibrio hydrothermalis AM13 = DSM 14728 TaxID=1121451 RepID=L0RER5_9BACT|nr:protein of unknown function [Maridesulfovibrio hydrothermalis AM13 = DSM 14728]